MPRASSFCMIEEHGSRRRTPVLPEGEGERFLGAALAEANTARITITWTGDRSLSVLVDDMLDWSMELGATGATRVMSAGGAHLPDAAWRSGLVLRAMSATAGPFLSIGKVLLTGHDAQRPALLGRPPACVGRSGNHRDPPRRGSRAAGAAATPDPAR
jgi:hypothetical protein